MQAWRAWVIICISDVRTRRYTFMRPTRAVLLVVATALAPALLFTAPAFANGSAAPVATTVMTMSDTPVDEMSEDELRAAIAVILADEGSGRGVARVANEALNGT